MPKFTKKPVTIEAMQFDGTVESADAIREWATMPDGMSAECARDSHKGACTYLGIRTLEGTMRANSGDWIIKGIKGEFYPCKPDIFEATYARELDRKAPGEWVMVPRRPTEAMENAAAHWQRTEYDCDPLGDRGRFYRGIYGAMLAAAPPKDTADEQ